MTIDITAAKMGRSMKNRENTPSLQHVAISNQQSAKTDS
jgi:hypothetical protein